MYMLPSGREYVISGGAPSRKSCALTEGDATPSNASMIMLLIMFCMIISPFSLASTITLSDPGTAGIWNIAATSRRIHYRLTNQIDVYGKPSHSRRRRRIIAYFVNSLAASGAAVMPRPDIDLAIRRWTGVILWRIAEVGLSACRCVFAHLPDVAGRCDELNLHLWTQGRAIRNSKGAHSKSS